MRYMRGASVLFRLFLRCLEWQGTVSTHWEDG